MEQKYRYRGFDIAVDAQRETDVSDCARDEIKQCAYIASVRLSTSLIAGEWSTDFRVEPMPGRSPADLREVLAAGFAAATKVVDDVMRVMGDVLAGRQSEGAPQALRDQRRANAEQLVQWLERNQPATLARVVSAGVMSMADAANALQYGIRHRIIVRDGLPDAAPGGACRYRLTGRPLVFERPSVIVNPFDALLTAWGIALVPPELPGRLSVRVMLG
ncbi:conserved hypothetical protein [Ricinus communis]|uniref:Uncharacterized protein n=1 Tax=Ricinus communis TaxID=3988 RepID=B9TGM0_RICCO|nr:conserved hypothetical protein [Ricinus communis]